MKNLNETFADLRSRGVTLLFTCPMSEEVVQAALEESRDFDFPAIFTATLNQVDTDGGYTGWTQEGLVNWVRETASEIGYNGPIVFARDHGGPWVRDNQKKIEDETAALDYIMDSNQADVEAGWQFLHIDCTFGPPGKKPSFDDVIRRTGIVFDSAYRFSRQRGIELCYEVGTEEVSGGLTEVDVFERYIVEIEKELQNRGIAARPSFIVAQTGSNLGLEGTGRFDGARAKQFVDLARRHGMGIKQHFTDDMPDDTLRLLPKIGVAAANVGPEFSTAQTKALFDLADKVSDPSDFRKIVEDAVLADGHWKRWLKKDETSLTPEDRRDIAIVCGRYVYRNIEVATAIRKLFADIKEQSGIDAGRYVKDAIRKVIHRFVESFNLQGINSYF